MANEVYANGREVSCKAGSGKSIAAFPDTCFTPPQTPATPPGVPIPYPNTGMASDCTEGSKTVQISGQEVMLKDKSYYKKSTGDEAGSAPKKGVITSQITGKVYFTAWSMDVKFEGENVDRHLDMTTHNHGSPSNTPPMLNQDGAASGEKPCSAYEDEEKSKCVGAPQEYKTNKKGELEPDGLDCSKHPGCAEAKACVLKPKSEDKTFCCRPSTTGHHLIEVHGFCKRGERGKTLPQFPNYKMNDAPCVCAEGSRHDEEHGDLHAIQGLKENYAIMTAKDRNPPRAPDYAWNYREARQAGVEAHQETFDKAGCNPKCIGQQLDDYHADKLPNGEDTLLRTEKNKLGSATTGQLATGLELVKGRAERILSDIIGAPFGLR